MIIKMMCACGWRGDLHSCGPIKMFDAARCPKCETPAVAYRLMEIVREERRRERQGYNGYRHYDDANINGDVISRRHYTDRVEVR